MKLVSFIHMDFSSNPLSVRRLGRQDASAFQELRLYALQESAEVYGASFKDEQNKRLSQIEDQIQKDFVYGAFIANELIGVACGYASLLAKLSHKIHIYGNFVHPQHRKKGIMKRLIEALLSDAFRKHEIALASVAKANKAALAVFSSCGFMPYGMEEKAMKIGDQYSHLILLRYDRHEKH